MITISDFSSVHAFLVKTGNCRFVAYKRQISSINRIKPTLLDQLSSKIIFFWLFVLVNTFFSKVEFFQLYLERNFTKFVVWSKKDLIFGESNNVRSNKVGLILKILDICLL